MHAQEVAQEARTCKRQNGVKLHLIRKKFQMQVENPIHNKLQVLPQTTNNRKKFTVIGLTSIRIKLHCENGLKA